MNQETVGTVERERESYSNNKNVNLYIMIIQNKLYIIYRELKVNMLKQHK